MPRVEEEGRRWYFDIDPIALLFFAWCAFIAGG
jgi:hypothetical protein